MTDNTIRWSHAGETHQAEWLTSIQPNPPKWFEVIGDQTNADTAYRLASEGCGMIYQGDFQNARQLLQALARRIDKKPLKAASTMLETFHLYRARQIQRANILNKVILHLAQGRSSLKRAPDASEALACALDSAVPASLLIPLQMLQGMVGAYEWRKKGVMIPVLGQNIYPYYGVYSPVRGEYLELIAQAPLQAKTAMDIGTGTGVIAALLARRGVPNIIATDNQPRALACAQDNLQRLGFANRVKVVEADLFPLASTVDLIVCNPPWLPAKANAPIEHAVYDQDSRMLKAFLAGVKAHLNVNGEAWLIMSDLAEQIGLRKPGELAGWIADAGLEIVQRLDTQPKHAKARDEQDPLFAARSKEATSLYRLKSR
ncbi:methyltransferase [Methylophilus sp. 3sh_L]|uniref:methyltransferase n=1 Tax=Methylophilus sp. 3sh_L TaxID=3377114 RepID=UPI00398F4895